MEERLLTHLDDLIQAIKTGADWTVTQGGLLAQEIVEYKQLIAGIEMVVLGIIGVLLIALVPRLIKISKEKNEPWFLIAIIPLIFVVPLFLCCTTNYVKCVKAPRLVVIEEITNLVGHKECKNDK